MVRHSPGWFAQNRDRATAKQNTGHKKQGDLIDALHRLPTYMGMCLPLRDQIKALAAKLQHTEHMFVLGKGLGEPIAQEGALKIKEISYIHAEGYGGGSLKHGPFALLDKGTPVIFLVGCIPNPSIEPTPK
jgi:glucosamine--fructose-6-phosphate aminotransferase (isomerizing)